MHSEHSLLRQQRGFLRLKQAKRLLKRLTIAAFTDPSLRWKWMGVLCGLIGLFLLFPSSLDRVPPLIPKSRDIVQNFPQPETTEPEPPSIFDPFPFPEALQPQVAFWRDVFTQYTTDHMIIHDNWYLPVVYEVVDVSSPEFTSKEEGRKAVQAAQKKYRTVLTNLSKKWDDPNSMTVTERQIYDLFQKYPESSRFKKKDAKDRIRVQVGQADRVKEGLIRAGGYLDAMKQILADHDLPETFVYLPIIESSFNTQAQSYLGATGMWQFMRSTGKQYNLTINAYVDERKDPLHATRAAAELLSYNYRKIQSWPLAITAYNHGLQGMKNAVSSVGTADIETIIEKYKGSKFGFASRNFYPEFLAAIEVGLRYAEYFGELELHAPLNLTQMKLTEYVTAKTLEKYTALSIADIKRFNPALHPSVFNSGNFLPKNYTLNIPLDQSDAFRTAYAAIPQSLRPQAITTKYRVKKGETLSLIARRYKVSLSTLIQLNNISNPRKLRAGQILKIPGGYVATAQRKSSTSSSSTSTAGTRTHRVEKGHTLTAIARRYGTTVTAIASLNNIKNTGSIRIGQVLKIPGNSASSQQTASASQTPSVHRVKKGQTLTSIAKQYNTTVQALASLNKISNPRRIKPGQLLKIPPG